MSIAHWCVLIAAWLPVLTAGLAKASTARLRRGEGAYDNHDPRVWFAQQTGWRQRADSAQKNGFENLPLFIGAVALAEIAHADPQRVDTLAMTYVGLRVLYTVAYLADWAALRSLIWVGGMVVSAMILMSTPVLHV